MALLLGAHMSIAKGFVEAAIRTREVYNANAMQIFTKNPRGRAAKPLDAKVASEFKKYCKKNGVEFVVSHGSYLLNFAKPLPQNHWSIANLVDDLKRITALGGVGVVLHVGKHLELSYAVAERELVKNIKVVLKKTATLKNTKIIIENTAGQGTEMGTTFEALASLYKKLGKSSRIGFCIDTCHTFASGYDWKKGPEKVFKQWDKLIGIDKIDCLHFNDSLKGVDSRRDRHHNIGKGEIGIPSLKKIVQFAKKNTIPLILETPEKTLTHEDDLKVIRTWKL
jgi:deoxyribonuclease IV